MSSRDEGEYNADFHARIGRRRRAGAGRAINGRNVLAKLVEQTCEEPTAPEPVFMDFSGVEVATASFLGETVLVFRDSVRRRHSNFYPAIANASALVEDELKVLWNRTVTF